LGNDLISLLVVSAALIAVIYVFIRIAVRLRKYGGSLTTTLFASTYEFLNKDKQKAVEEIVETKANKKLEEQKSGEENND
jgi:predicted Holliday junction resolvase-like endonuclease